MAGFRHKDFHDSFMLPQGPNKTAQQCNIYTKYITGHLPSSMFAVLNPNLWFKPKLSYVEQNGLGNNICFNDNLSAVFSK